MFRSALVAIKPSAVQDSLTDYAVKWASQHKLALSALSVIDRDQLAPNQPVPIGGGGYKASLDEHKLATARQKAEAALASFEQACQAAAVPCQTQIYDGNAATVVGRLVQRHDLLLVGHVPGGDTSDTSVFHQILRNNPRPAIIVPQAIPNGSTTVVAYDGSLPAARALAAFVWSGVGRDRPVHVLAMHRDPDHAQALADVAGEFLTSHGIQATCRGAAISANISKTLLEQAQSLSANMLVMGAFGQPVVKEFFFGSVTKGILESLPMPLFVEH